MGWGGREKRDGYNRARKRGEGGAGGLHMANTHG